MYVVYLDPWWSCIGMHSAFLITKQEQLWLSNGRYVIGGKRNCLVCITTEADFRKQKYVGVKIQVDAPAEHKETYTNRVSLSLAHLSWDAGVRLKRRPLQLVVVRRDTKQDSAVWFSMGNTGCGPVLEMYVIMDWVGREYWESNLD